ncbi:sensor histidine kinase [Nocardioides caricicola]|uniref:Sensor histidine kinase n=1 Tax=Nocardioides caricicola TaxID=634770 RepID=A0ABW0MZX0_9ACTN
MSADTTPSTAPPRPVILLTEGGTRQYSGVGRARAAAAIAVVSWALAVVAVVLMFVGRPVIDELLWFFVVDASVACVYGTVAAVTLSRRAHPVPWLLGLAAVGGGLAAFGYAYEVWSARPGGLEPNETLAMLQNTAWVPGTIALFLVVPWLVRDHPLGWEWLGVLAGSAVTTAITLAAVFEWEQILSLFRVSIGLGLLTAAVVELRHRFGPAEERNGLGWLALGTTILAVSFVPVVSPQTWLPFWTTPILHLVSQTIFPAAVLVAVLRNRMWGLRLVVSRAVLAGLLAAGLLGLYIVTTLVLTRLLPSSDGLAHLLAAGAVAVAVQPARLVAARRVHALVYGDATDPSRVVRRLGSQLVGSTSVEELLSGVTEDIGRSMRLESVTVDAEGIDPVRWGRPTEAPTSVDLRHRGERVGVIEVSPLPGEALSARDLTTLRDLSSVVAAAVAVARAGADLAEMRLRLAAARLEERRVLRREIHDGLGPSLAGIRLGLQGARNLLATDPEAGQVLLARLQDEVDAATNGVRSLSHHLLPPVLDELGLGAALTELAGRYDGSGLHVDVECDRLEGLDPQVAAAAYGIASEATTNVARHADATHCWISAVRHVDGFLLLVIADDGRGVSADVTPGVGSRSMRERAEEQGGSLDVRPRPGGGTEVHATIPLEVARA